MIHPTALIDPTAVIGSGTSVWAFVQIAEHAEIGSGCVIGNGAYIDRYVRIGNRVRIHNKALLYHGVVIEDDVFIGPGVCFTNDAWPKSGQTRDLTGKSWTVGEGASIGANVTVLPDVSIGRHAMIGAGSVVTRDVPAYALYAGNPARFHGMKCKCSRLFKEDKLMTLSSIQCPDCKNLIPVPKVFK